MKTIEEAAIDCALKDEFPNGYDAECAGFKSGVNFAEEWIKVDDELPSEENCICLKFKTKRLWKQNSQKVNGVE